MPQILKVIPKDALQVRFCCVFATIFQLRHATELVNLPIQVKHESVDPLVVTIVSVGLNEYFCQVKRPRLVETTVSYSQSHLAELGSQYIDYLAERTDLKRLGSHSKNLIVHVKQLLLT